MKYITTIEKMKYTNAMRIYYDTRSKKFIIKIKETGKRMVFDIYKDEYVDLAENYNLYELSLLNGYFFVNKDELLKIIDNIENYEGKDFISNDLKVMDVDYNNTKFIFEIARKMLKK